MTTLLDLAARLSVFLMLAGVGVAAIGACGLMLGEVAEKFEDIYDRSAVVAWAGAGMFTFGVGLIFVVFGVGVPTGLIE